MMQDINNIEKILSELKNVGIKVSEFYKYEIELTYFHFGYYEPLKLEINPLDDKHSQNYSQVLKEFVSDEEIKKEFFDLQHQIYQTYDDILNIKEDNISSIVNIITNKILALNHTLYKEVSEKLKETQFKYTPTCRIIFTDVESMTPVIENTTIGKLLKSFIIRVPIYNAIKDNVTVEVVQLNKLAENAIRELLDIVRNLGEEETFEPPQSFLELWNKPV